MKSRGRGIVVPLAILLLMCIALVPAQVAAQGETFEPTSVSVHGTIVDNYANFTYEMFFDNTGSSFSREVNWFFGLQTGIRLSNVSVVMGEDVYWGKVIPESDAIITYEESVEMGKTAVLVTRGIGGYDLSMNVANNTGATLCVFVEGLLIRHLGLYSLEVPIVTGLEVDAIFDADLSIISHYGPLSGYRVAGLSDMIATDIPNGIRVRSFSSNIRIPDLLALEYALDRQEGGSQLITYNNGTDNFFTYLLAPSISESEEYAPREYVFVLDRSGSMSGTKLEQAKIAFNSMIADLNTNDIFNVISFSTNVDVLWSEPYSASSTNIASA
ncbi:MAG: VIT domain-containing protein [Candidatus Thorarchaeota archaeon]|nr:VIT domain-containing protein [Candidatus Thorarchaeota archaeon]